MSTDSNQIICRKCNENISRDNSACPNCGTSMRGTIPYAVGIVFGAILMIAAVLNIGELLAYGIIGLLVAASSGYMLYERRQRIDDAGGESRTFEG